ncbi:DUF1330 domain-containing protein [Nocardia mexicana]|uniref:Uncharacterized protein (DUF1330 family) n=1 Tax=Nocardia mexicana TaxID=279262 RepID=A0A370HA41_9NOCA|nr:DUF1330 domain-containing protein [Nocardia mexicana]RDI53306.1 uncharacterized protein (DUF1330 family) [Nocardia mexicana]
MPAYMIAHLLDPVGAIPEQVLEYREKIQSTLDPFGGRFLVHGDTLEIKEGSWPGSLVMIEFPSMDHARDFYDSPAYRAIKPLRTDHLDGDLIIVDGCGPEHDSAAQAAELRAAQG